MDIDILLPIAAFLLYPGLLFLLLLTVLFAALSAPGRWQAEFAALRQVVTHPGTWSLEQFANLASIVLAAGGLALLPWPWNPAAPSPVAWLWAWGALEAAFLLALLPGLLASNPPVVRAAIRAAQIGLVGRATLWLALTASLLIHAEWQLLGPTGHSPLLVHVLALASAVLAFPIAVGRAGYAEEVSLTPGGVQQGLDTTTIELAGAAQTVRTAALLAASLVALLPVSSVLLPPPLGVALVLAGVVAGAQVLKWLDGRWPRLTLPTALRHCLLRALPLGAAAAVFLGLI
jgi:hypothetical protein